MKKTALAIAFAVATLPLTFAAQTPASGQQPTTESTKKPVKKHAKKTKKSETTKSSPASK